MMIAHGLIALGVGYLVYVTASKEKEGVKLLGQAIGIFVMIASVLSVVCSSMYGAHKDRCSMSGRSECPLMAKSNCSLASQTEEK